MSQNGSPNPRTIQVRCTQLSPIIGDLDGNLRRIDTEIAHAVRDGIDLLVLPELATSGYNLTETEAREAAWAADGAELGGLAEQLRGSGTTVVFGFPELAAGSLYNSAAILTPDSPPVVYRKLHLWNTEKLIFTPGEDLPPVVETPAGRLAAIVCYDLEFPELPRTVALAGAEILAVPTNWPLHEQPSDERAAEVIHAMAAAQASGMIVACCDRAGEERGVSWMQGTSIVAADGWPVRASLDEDQRLDAALVLDPGRHQTSERNHHFLDRRPELYRVTE